MAKKKPTNSTRDKKREGSPSERKLEAAYSAVPQRVSEEDLKHFTEFNEAFLWVPAKTPKEAARLEKLREKVFRAARETIVDGIASEADESVRNWVLVYSYASRRLLHTYATLNYGHSHRIDEVIRTIGEYSEDHSLQRPLNFLLLASPGSGKSQLVKSIAQKITNARVDLASFNMATMQAKDDLSRVIDVARNMVVDRKLPLIFLDEFDSQDEYYSLLLPLLWDGELDVLNRDLRLGRSVFFLAGSRSSLPEKLNNAREMFDSQARGLDDNKLVDLLSRINGGVIEIPSLTRKDAVADKVVIAMQLLRLRFTACEYVPQSLLWFIGQTKFRYESRSIATLVNLIRVGKDSRTLKRLTMKDHLSSLPFDDPKKLRESPLAFHLLDIDRVDGLIELWKEAKRRQGDQRIRHKYSKNLEAMDAPEWFQFAALVLGPSVVDSENWIAQ